MKRFCSGSAACLFVFLCACSGFRPDTVNTGTQAPCPSSPNCVSSRAAGDVHAIEPLAVTGDMASAMDRLADIVKAQPRTRIIRRTDTYLYAEFRTRLFRFCDDVEFFADPAAGVIHVRSASRLGYSDLGVNRARVEKIREIFQKRTAESDTEGDIDSDEEGAM